MHFLKVEWFVERVFIASSIGTLYYPLCLLLFHETLKIPLRKDWKFHLYVWLPMAYYLLLACWYTLAVDPATQRIFVEANLYYNWESSFLFDLINIPLNFIFLGHIIYFLFFLFKINKLTKGYDLQMIRKRYRFVRAFILSLISVSILLIIFLTLDFDPEFVDVVLVPMGSNVLTIMIVFFAFDGRLVSEEPTFEYLNDKSQNVFIPKKEILSAEDTEVIRRKVDVFFKDSDTYLNSDFTLQRLANSLSVSPHHLSYAINTKYGKSFSDLLAQHRINCSKAVIESEEFTKMTIEAIGQSVGYKSKSTFFNHFKRNTGQTPLDYKKASNR